MTFTSEAASSSSLCAQPVDRLTVFQQPVDEGIPPAEVAAATIKAKPCFAVGGFDCGSRYIFHRTAPLELASIVITLDLEPRQGSKKIFFGSILATPSEQAKISVCQWYRVSRARQLLLSRSKIS
jgi:hypothetical protein